MRSPNKFRLKYILDCLYNSVTNPFTCVRGLESGKGRFAENISPRVRTPRMNEMVHHRNPPSPLSEDEVSYKPFAWVRSLESGKDRFAENTSPSSENTKKEQVWFTSEILSRLWVEMRSVISCSLGLEVSRTGKVGSQNTSPSSENAKVEQRSLQLNPPLTLSNGDVS